MPFIYNPITGEFEERSSWDPLQELVTEKEKAGPLPSREQIAQYVKSKHPVADNAAGRGWNPAPVEDREGDWMPDAAGEPVEPRNPAPTPTAEDIKALDPFTIPKEPLKPAPTPTAEDIQKLDPFSLPKETGSPKVPAPEQKVTPPASSSISEAVRERILKMQQEEQEHQNQLSSQRMQHGIGSALVNVGQNLANLRGQGTVRLTPSGKSDQLQSLEDQMTPTQRMYIEGITKKPVPAGMSMSRFSKMFPDIADLIASREKNEAVSSENALDRVSEEKVYGAKTDQLAARTNDAKEKEFRTIVNRERASMVAPTSAMGKLRDAANSVDNVLEELRVAKEQNNPVAARAAMVATAKKLGGDTGVLTQQDIEAYEGSIGLPGLWRNLQKFWKGNFSDATIQDLEAAVTSMGKIAKQKYQDQGSMQLKSFGIANKELMDEIGYDPKQLPGAFGLAPPTRKFSVGTKKFNIPEDLADKFIQEHPDAVEAK